MKSQTYAAQSIAASGIAIMDWRIALELRPDLWSSAQDCHINFISDQKLDGTHRLTATLEGHGKVRVYARSLDLLEKRIEWIAGRRVIELKPAELEQAPAPKPSVLHTQAADQEAARIADLRKIAAQEPPAHDCSLRREILAARAELNKSHA
ncbi:hypothetical protein [Thauera sp. Sel9]|uniref:hypothetical protein n=1 Tax=Thauera sp. Sel9 TaxID=2974299 RepID=UPI0021E104F7|nr:hypothetical protein [Thauera sp. Sel9]MCV2218895.1 hypothetical protein [Thauera sp. Sel9]